MDAPAIAVDRPMDCTDWCSDRARSFGQVLLETLGHLAHDLGFGGLSQLLQLMREWQQRQQLFVRAQRPPEFWIAGTVVGSHGHFAARCVELLRSSLIDKDLSGTDITADWSDLGIAVARLREDGYLPADYILKE